MTESDPRPDDGIWFEPKRYGYGAGLPVAWHGWALLGGFTALMMVAALALAERHPLAFGLVALALIAGFLPICAMHTRGGWRWRWGGE